MSADTADLKTGDVVVDREADADEQNAAVVVNTPPVAAEEWRVFNGVTVAEYGENDQYDPTAPVAVVVFREELADWRPDYRGRSAIPVVSLRGAPVDFYTFPAPRLEVVEPTDEDTAGPLYAIRDAVRERRVDSVAIDRREEVVVVEKLGVEYRVKPDGSVDDGGLFGEQLEQLAREAVETAGEVSAK